MLKKKFKNKFSFTGYLRLIWITVRHRKIWPINIFACGNAWFVIFFATTVQKSCSEKQIDEFLRNCFSSISSIWVEGLLSISASMKFNALIQVMVAKCTAFGSSKYRIWMIFFLIFDEIDKKYLYQDLYTVIPRFYPKVDKWYG